MIVNGTTYHEETPEAVTRILENARTQGWRLRIWYGDAKTGRSWEEEWDVVGRIARSSGPMRVPILLAATNSIGGPALLDQCILKIVKTDNKLVLYQHPKFKQPHYTVTKSTLEGYTSEVLRDGKTAVARFRSPDGAQRWIDFMYGKAMSKGGKRAK